MQRLVFSLLLVVGALLVTSPALAQEISFTSAITPTQGGAGTEVTVSGRDAWPDQNVTVTLTPQTGSSAGAWVTLDVVPNADGTFSAVFTIPTDVPAGVYFVRVEQTNPERFISQHFWHTFTVGTPTVPTVPVESPAVTTGEAPGVLPQTGGALAVSGRMHIVLGLSLLVIGLVSRGLYRLVGGK